MTFVMKNTVEDQFPLFFMRNIFNFTFQKPFSSAEQLRKDRPCAKELPLATALSGMDQSITCSEDYHLILEFLIQKQKATITLFSSQPKRDFYSPPLLPLSV